MALTAGRLDEGPPQRTATGFSGPPPLPARVGAAGRTSASCHGRPQSGAEATGSGFVEAVPPPLARTGGVALLAQCRGCSPRKR